MDLGIHWQHKEWMMVLLPVWAVAVVLAWGWYRRFRRLDMALGQRRDAQLPGVRLREFLWRYVLFFVGLSAIVLALARPQWGFHYEAMPERGSRIMMAVDVSESMLAQDLKPNRLEVARRALYDVTQILQGDQVGLVAFAGVPFLLCPPTSDYEAFRLYIEMLEPSLIPLQGTDFAAAITLALKSFDDEKKETDSRAIVLITDGEDHSDALSKALDEAKQQGVKIFVVGLGSAEGAPVPETEDQGGFKKDNAGNVVFSRLDEATLSKIAQITGGTLVKASDGSVDLVRLYQRDIQGIVGKEEIEGKQKRVYHEQFGWPLALGMVLTSFSLLQVRLRRSAMLVVAMMGLTIATVSAAEPAPTSAPELASQEKAMLDMLSRDPNNPKHLYNTGNFYYGAHRYDEAQAYYERALSVAPLRSQEGLQTLFNLGDTLYRQGKLEEAVDAFDKILSVDPSHRAAELNRDFIRKQLAQQEQKSDQSKQNDTQDNQNQQNDTKDASSQESPNQDQSKEKSDSQNSQQDQASAKPEDKKDEDNSSEGQTPKDEHSNQKDEQNKDAAQSQPKPQPSSDADQKQAPKPQSGEEATQAPTKEDDAKKRAERWLEAVPEDNGDILQRQLRRRLPRRSMPEKDW